MPIRVYVYSHDAYKEYTLSDKENKYNKIELSGEYFGLCADIEVEFKVQDDTWTFAESSQYIVYKEEVPYIDEVLICRCIYKLVTTSREYIYLYAAKMEDSAVVYDKYDISNISKLSIGSRESNTIRFQNLNLISRVHVTIEKFHNGVILDDLSCNGVFVNGKRINGRTYITFGSKIFLFGLELVYMGNVMAVYVSSYDDYKISNAMIKYYEQMPIVCADKEEDREQVIFYNRSPRSNISNDRHNIKIMSKPNIELTVDTDKYLTSSKDSVMLVAMVLGICAMGGVYLKGAMKLAAGIAVVLVGIVFLYLVCKVVERNKINKIVRLNEERQKRSRRLYEKYLSDQDKIIEEKTAKYREYMYDRYRSSKEYAEYSYASMDLWNRNVNHDDFLRFRVGLGKVVSNVDVEIPDREEFKGEFLLYNKVKNLKAKYRVMEEMPICIDLKKERIVGVVSENKKIDARNIIDGFVTSIATNTCYTDVKVAFIFDEKEEEYDMYRWLPHVWSEDGSRRYIANTEESAKELLNELYKEIVAGNSETYYILVVSKVSFLVKEPFFRLMSELEKHNSFSVLLSSKYCRQLPNICEFILQNDSKFRGILNVKTQKRTQIVFDTIDTEEVEKLVERLAPIRVPEVITRGESKEKCTILEVHEVEKVSDLYISERWEKNNAYEGLNIPIGLTKKNDVFYLNVHENYFGPHGLIAGMTGSGKSEFIKSFITSLAINYSPEDVNFLIIDYKGGIMAYELESLPHVVGTINNMSKEIVDRTLMIVKGEVDRRSKLLSTYGVNNIDMLLKLGKCGEIPVKVPHLFIVVDEFARLKEMEPEFIKELVSLSAVGRSLGINLLLATQKPSGNIDENIWSNSKYRVCLKVVDEQDSYEVLHNVAAANIASVGGAYIQVGNDEIFEEIQTAYTSEIYDDRLVEKKIGALLMEYNGSTNDFRLGRIIKKKEKLRLLFIEKLIYMLISINKKTNIIYSNELTEENFEIVIKGLYEKLEEEKIEYEYTSINSKKLCNFVGLFILVDKMEFKTIHEQAGEVIRRADNEDIMLPQVAYKSQLECIIDEIKSAAEHKYNVSKLMLEELGTHICHEDITPKALLSHYEALVGLYDDPYGLKQEGFYINQVKDGHIIVYGSILSGKTTLLLTYLYDMLIKYTKRELRIYGIDCNNGSLKNIEGASAVSKLYFEDCEDTTIEDVLSEVKSIIATRKKAGNGADIVRSYEDNRVKAPLVLLVVDDIVKLAKLNAGKYEADILDILKDGMAVGVYVFATASGIGSSALTSRLASGFKTSICMQLKDKYEYMQCMHYVGDMILPKKNIPGRGIAMINDKLLEFQVSIPHGEVIDSKRMQILRELVGKLDKDKNEVASQILDKAKAKSKVVDSAKVKVANNAKVLKQDKASDKEKVTEDGAKKEKKLTETKITWTAHKSNKEVKRMLKEDKLPLGVDSSNNQMYCINLKDTYVYTIVGGAKTGKTGIIKVLMSLASINKNDKVYVVDFTAKLYSKVAARLKAEYVTTAEQFNAMLEELAKEFSVRKTSPKEEKIFVFGDMERFVKAIYRPVKNGLDAVAFMENVSAKGQGHNIYFVMEMGLDVDRKLKDYPVYQNFMSYNAGLCTSDSDKDFDTTEGINIPTIRG